MRSRLRLVKQVAENIRENHAGDPENSFVFGISGKWGEGKTTFLHDLENELTKKDEFRIIWIKPWKYGEDKISLLRNFLISLKPHPELLSTFQKIWNLLKNNKQNNKKMGELKEILSKYQFKRDLNMYFREFRRWINNRSIKGKLFFDRNVVSFHCGYVIIYVLAFVLILLLYRFSDRYGIDLKQTIDGLRWFYGQNSGLVYLLLVSVLIPIIFALSKALTTTQITSKSVQTVDLFDDLLIEVIKDENSRKLLVFVDDLDRVTPKTARNTLDNLRVFFNRKDISFVVTGDHSVLERYIGEQTLPYGEPNEQSEEGRRYLKKMFNVYLRLPLLIESEFSTGLKKILDLNNRKSQLRKIFRKRGVFNMLVNILEKYFDRNFRAVERFIDNIVFIFKVVDIQIVGVSKDEKRYLKDLREYPLLVVRVLLIQEFASPLFEKIARNIEILDQLELFVHKKDRPRFDAVLEENIAKELTISQKEQIARILFDNEGFYNDRGFQVQSYQPFIHLAADATFGDTRGPIPDEFVTALDSGDVQRVKDLLVDGGDLKLTQAAKSAAERLNSLSRGDVNKFASCSKTLVSALSLMDKDHRSQAIFINQMTSLELESVLQKMPAQERVEHGLLYWLWLDSQKNVETTWLDKFQLISNEDFNYVKLPEGTDKYGDFSTKILSNWFNKRYKDDKNDALEKINPHLDKLDERFQDELNSLTQTIVDDFISDEDIQRRNIRIKIISDFGNTNHKQNAINYILSKIDEQNETIASWAISAIDGGYTKLWSQDDLENRIIKLINSCTTAEEVKKLIYFANGKLKNKRNAFWDRLFKSKSEFLVDSLFEIYNDETLRPFSPPEIIGQKLFSSIIDRIKLEDNSESKLNWLNLLVRQGWLWGALSEMPQGKSLNGIQRSKLEQIKQKVSEIKGSWKVTSQIT